MTDYIEGILTGGLIGYVLSVLTMLFVWSLCIVSARADGRQNK